MATWLITGSADFIRSYLVRARSQDAPAQLVVLNALTCARNLASIRELIDTRTVDFVRADIRDAQLVADVFPIEESSDSLSSGRSRRWIMEGPHAFRRDKCARHREPRCARDHWGQPMAHKCFCMFQRTKSSALYRGRPTCDEQRPRVKR